MPIPGVTFNNMRNIMSFPQSARGPMSGLPSSLPGNGGNMLGQVLFGAATFVHNARPQAEALINSLGSINAIFGRASAVSTNREVMQVSSFTGTSIPDVSVVVDAIARPQQNQGATMSSSATDFQPGTFSFEIESEGQTHAITFTTTEALTNRAFMERVAKEINESEAPVNASVTNANGNSALNISSNATGVPEGAPHFAVRDISGGAMQRLGVLEMTHEPENAVFRINGGEPITQASNEVDLGGGLTVTLLKASEESASVREGRDEIGMRAILRTIVGQVNSFLETARTNSSDNRTRSLVRELESVLRRSRRDLNNAGISIARDGRLVIDEARFRAASEDGTTANIFGTDSRRTNHFVAHMSRIAENVSRNPMRHVSPSVTRLPGFNNALEVIASGGSNASSANAFAAYFMQESFGSLFDSRS